MRTATGLALIAIGAILAFAVTTSPSFFNFQIAGWVILLTGIAGLVVPRRGYGWLRRTVVRRPRGSATDPEGGRRARVPGRAFRRSPDLPDPAPSAAERTADQTVPGTAQPTEETVEEFFEE